VTVREDFDDDEWYQLRSAPWQAAMGVIEVDPSGGIAAGHEIEAVEAELAAGQFDEGLVGLVTRDLLDLDGPDDGTDRPSAGPTAAAAESVTAGDSFPDLVLAAMASVRTLLDAKAPGESEAFRTWLVALATAAAEAGREGFAGLAGPKVSDDEAGYLDRLRETLGVS
jgi:hypothetical protein